MLTFWISPETAPLVCCEITGWFVTISLLICHSLAGNACNYCCDPSDYLTLGQRRVGQELFLLEVELLFSTENGTFPNTPPPKKAFNCWASVLSLFIYVFRIIRAWRVQQKGSRLSVPKAGTLMLSDTGHPGFRGFAGSREKIGNTCGPLAVMCLRETGLGKSLKWKSGGSYLNGWSPIMLLSSMPVNAFPPSVNNFIFILTSYLLLSSKLP